MTQSNSNQTEHPKHQADAGVETAQDAMQQSEAELEQAQQTIEQDIQSLLIEAQNEAAKHRDMALRLQADMENLRRRTRLDVENAHKYALEKFVAALLPAMDSMEMGIVASAKEEATKESIREGVEMTFKQLLDVLADFQVERIDPLGEKFNPQEQEALTMVPSPAHESQTVMDVIQKGYKLNERLVRPARVVVAQ
ncbi:MAG: nucleotide exchange factor GrpE [Thiotrichales bacterium]|nr:nucleotide exchange factor GrpE [Thiotrichales bacterium]